MGYWKSTNVCCDCSWGLGAVQAPELLQGDQSGWARSVHWESPSSTLLPCLLILQPDGSWSHTELCAAPAVPKGTAANSTVQRHSTHSLGKNSPTAPTHGEGLLPAVPKGTAANRGHNAETQHTLPLVRAHPEPPLLEEFPGGVHAAHCWGMHRDCTHSPTGCLQRGFPFLLHPQ